MSQSPPESGDPAEWIRAFADALGLAPLEQATIDAVLELASVAAHASQRWAAPVAAFLAGRAGAQPAVAVEIARGLGPAPASPA